MRPGRVHPGNVDNRRQLCVVANPASMRPGRLHPRNGLLMLWNNFKAHLSEMVVQRQCPANSQLSHKNKAAAVGKGKFLIPIAEEERPRPFSSRFVNGLNMQASRAVDLLPPSFSSIKTKAEPDGGQSLINHIVGRRQYPS